MNAPNELPVTVVIPTIGRPQLLAGALASITSCQPRAEEVLVVDQSDGAQIADTVAAWAGAGVVRVADGGTGIGRALNAGLRHARHDLVLITNDDCTVAPGWVGAAYHALQSHPDAVLTGQVRPGAGGPGDGHVPSTIADPRPRDHTGRRSFRVLYGANMAVDRRHALALGGFDERPGLGLAAEDNDFCYRWLRAGRPLWYLPSLLVCHHDWRTNDQLAHRYRQYARGQGALYAKHLRAGDRIMLLHLLVDIGQGALRGLRRLAAGHPRRWEDPHRASLLGVPAGFAREWWATRPGAGGAA